MTQLQLQQPNIVLGAQGEQKAIHFLKENGYQILHQNVRSGLHELDIVALDLQLNEVVFVEVKTRTQDYSGHPSHAINFQKSKSLNTAAKAYLKQYKLTQDYRFDLITILPETVEHYQNITW